MKLETYLNAMAFAHYKFEQSLVFGEQPDEKRYRQYHAFRARILRMFDYTNEQEAMLRLTIDELRNEIDEKDELIEMMEAGYAGLQYELIEANKQIGSNANLLKIIAEKDARIAELDAEIERLREGIRKIVRDGQERDKQ